MTTVCIATMTRRGGTCQVCWAHRSAGQRICHVCRRRVNPGCVPEYCLAQDGFWDEPPGRRTLCKDCFISMEQAILPLAAVIPDALIIVATSNGGRHRWRAQDAIERLQRSL